MSKVAKINFQINPKAFYAAIGYGYLVGLNPRNFIREGEDIAFDVDRNNSPESRYLDDFLGRDARRAMLALQAIYSRMFPANARLVDELEKRLECQRRMAELSPLFEELLACESKGKHLNSIGYRYSSDLLVVGGSGKNVHDECISEIKYKIP